MSAFMSRKDCMLGCVSISCNICMPTKLEEFYVSSDEYFVEMLAKSAGMKKRTENREKFHSQSY